MPYIHMLSDPGMNYTLNRPLLDGTSAARITEINAVAPQIKDYESWHAVWLGLAKRAEAEKRWIDAASYYHGAEFYLPAGEVRNGFYDDFARNWALGMKGVGGVRAANQAHHFAAHDILGPRYDAEADGAGQGATVDIAVQGRRLPRN